MAALQSQIQDVNHNLQAIIIKLSVGSLPPLTPETGLLGTPLRIDTYGMFTPNCRLALPTTIGNTLDCFKTPKLKFPSFDGEKV